jgi:ribonuclease HII
MIAGVDEAGRGPLAGPVVAAAVILSPDKRINGLRDSKLLTAEAREILYQKITARAICWATGEASVEEIEKYNIYQANLLAMKRAVEALSHAPQEVWVDGRDKPNIAFPVKTIIDGDALIKVISAASIIAKVTRDRYMQKMDAQYPGYGFAAHKGYSTPQHLEALKRLGPCPIHRKTFAPVMEVTA